MATDLRKAVTTIFAAVLIIFLAAGVSGAKTAKGGFSEDAQPAKGEGASSSQLKGAPPKKSFPEGTPIRAIQDLDDTMDGFIVKEKGQTLTSSEESHNRALKQKILHGTFDIHELARLSLAKHWDSRSAAERDQFVTLLTDLLEEKALFSKEQSAAKSKNGGKYFVVYRGQKYDDEAKARAFVKTKVVVPSENVDIELDYRMKKRSDWKIYDIIVDEASLVDNYKYQFDSIIKKHGYSELVRRMRNKLTDIQGKRK